MLRLNRLLEGLLAVSAVGIAVTLAMIDGAATRDAERAASDVTAPQVKPSLPGSPRATAAPESTRAAASPPATADLEAPITVEAPRQVQIGSPNELVVSLGANADISDIAFTVQFDPNVLQARSGTKGDWASGSGSSERFEAAVSDGADRVQIHSAVTGRRRGGGGGIVAVVQFEPVGRGTTTVTIGNLMVRDLSGRPVGSPASTQSLQVTVE